MRKRVSSIFGITAVCVALGAAVFAVGAQGAVRHFDGTVVSKDSSAKTVRVRTQGGATVTVKANGRTRFERIGGGFAGLAKGMAVEVDASKVEGRWVATQIESRSGGGGQEGGGDDHGGGHGGGHDDGPNHT